MSEEQGEVSDAKKATFFQLLILLRKGNIQGFNSDKLCGGTNIINCVWDIEESLQLGILKKISNLKEE